MITSNPERYVVACDQGYLLTKSLTGSCWYTTDLIEVIKSGLEVHYSENSASESARVVANNNDGDVWICRLLIGINEQTKIRFDPDTHDRMIAISKLNDRERKLLGL